MATSQMNGIIQHLRRTVLLRDGTGVSDGQLLDDFISRSDGAALAALVQRHGPMVWGVCRRVLYSYHDAEDAFQATFLVLVRKAPSITPRSMVANWLYGVAHQTALKARATANTRKGRERQVVEMPEPETAGPSQWDDLLPVLDEELSRLPDKYRAVLVLCDLEGRTRKAAARHLGVPEGTVAGWVARARVMLAKRLTQRGVILSGGALATILSRNAASAELPNSVAASTIKAASLFAAGQTAGMISVKAAALTEGVLKTMFVMKLKTVAARLLLAAILCGAAGTILQTKAVEPPKAQQKDKPTTDAPTARNVRPPKAAPLREYVLVSKLMEAGADQPKELFSLPKLTVDEGQLGNLHLIDHPQNPLAKVGVDEELKIGSFCDVRVKHLEGNKVRLFCSFLRNEVEKSGAGEIQVVGHGVQIIRDAELHKAVKVVFQKDNKGSPLRWVEITVDEVSPGARPQSK